MAQSRGYKKTMNFVYGMGAAIVIIGALFKIQHISYGVLTGGLMLTIGLVVEAIVFAISAFDTPEDDLDWSKVYPELDKEGLSSENDRRELGADGMLSQKLDNLLIDAKIDASLMESLGASMKVFQSAAEGLSAASDSVVSTNKYNEELSKAAIKMESLNTLYQVQADNTSKQAELNVSFVENSEKLQEQMAALANNLSSLNGVYGNMLSAMSNK
jgi:gliding motility-associated protein GldL